MVKLLILVIIFKAAFPYIYYDTGFARDFD